MLAEYATVFNFAIQWNIDNEGAWKVFYRKELHKNGAKKEKALCSVLNCQISPTGYTGRIVLGEALLKVF